MKFAIAAVGLALVAASPASAHEGVPAVPGITVIYAPCPLPGTDLSDGCTWEGATVVYVSATTHRETLYHELGHQFAFRAFGDRAERPMAGPMRKFAHITRRPGNGARSPLDVREQFADAYAACALDKHPTGRYPTMTSYFPTGNEYDPTAHEHRLVCAMIWRTAARRGW